MVELMTQLVRRIQMDRSLVVGVLEFDASEFHALIDDAPNGSARHLAFAGYVGVAIAEGFEFVGL